MACVWCCVVACVRFCVVACVWFCVAACIWCCVVACVLFCVRLVCDDVLWLGGRNPTAEDNMVNIP